MMDGLGTMSIAQVTHMAPSIEHARTYARLGLRPIWLHSPKDQNVPEQQRGKKPLESAWQHGEWTHADNIKPPRTAGANIGLITGRVRGAPDGRAIVVVDADDPEADAWVLKNLPATPWTVTTRKGHHYYFKRPDAEKLPRFNVVINKDAGTGKIDVQCDGGQVVAPPSIHHTGHVYAANKQWRIDDLAQMPVFNEAWFADVRRGKRRAGGDSAVVGNRNNSLTSLAGRLRRAGASEDAILVEIRKSNSAMPMPLDDDEVRTIAMSVARYEPGAWVEEMDRTQSGQIKGTMVNVMHVLSNDQRWQQVVRWDDFTGRIVFCGVPPFDGMLGDVVFKPETVTPFRDDHYARIAAWMRLAPEYSMIQPSMDAVVQACDVIAHNNRFHQVAEYLNCLPEWDGQKRVDNWLTEYAGVEASEYSATVGRWFLIGAVARAIVPGTKVDTVLVLEGAQGIGKSTLARMLAPKEEWFVDSQLDLGSKEAMEKIRGKWIAELSEFAAVKKGDQDHVKAFITSTKDTYRKAYGREAADHPRTCVFIGSINANDGYIHDGTGARRYNPVKCVGPIAGDRLARDRDQIWAEALALYRSGAGWYVSTPAEKELVTGEQADRVFVDPWEHVIRECFEDRDDVTMGFIFDKLGVEMHTRNKAMEMRVAEILRKVGAVKNRSMAGGERQVRYRIAQ
jgi:predicted P-loop ATPase